jgi:gas vesicle protein
MLERKSSFILSFFIGGLIGGGIAFLLASSLMRTRSAKPARAVKTHESLDEMEEQSYEEGAYCAPEGADIQYDMGKDTYYSNGQ